MHFRARRNVVQLIRTTYDADKKRGVNTVVGTAPLGQPELPAALLQQLTPQEVEAFGAWVKTQWHMRQLRHELAALSLPETLALATAWFEQNAESPSAQSVAEDVAQQMQALRRVLKNKGLLE